MNGNETDIINKCESTEKSLEPQKSALLKSAWKVLSDCMFPPQVPLQKPEVDERFYEVSPIVRVVEALRYNIIYFEYTFSPNGFLRLSLYYIFLLSLWIVSLVYLINYFMDGILNFFLSLTDATSSMIDIALNLSLFVIMCIFCLFMVVIFIAILSNAKTIFDFISMVTKLVFDSLSSLIKAMVEKVGNR